MANPEETPYIELRGKRLRCVAKMPMGLLFDVAEGMDSGQELKAIAAMSRALRTLVVKEDHEQLREVVYDAEFTFDELNEALGALMKRYTERPLGQPSSSPTGPSATGGTPRVVSLWRASEAERLREEAAETAASGESSKDGESVGS
jgi:hypothetical protein